MNPSTEDIVKVIEQSGCKRAIILPNNKNIQMASQQAAEIVDVDAVVIPTKTIPQGIAAMFNYDSTADLEHNQEVMTTSLEDVKSGSITYAVRDTKIDGINIEKDAFMGLVEDKIVVSDKDVKITLQNTLEKMLDDDSEILTIIVGEEADDAQTSWIESFMESNYEDVEVEIQQGQQPIYPYFFSVE